MLWRQREHLVEQVGGDQHRAVVVDDDDVARKDCHPTAAYRLLPGDESQAGHRGWCSHTAAPDRQGAAQHPGDIAHDAIGDQGGNATFAHPGAQDVAEDAGVGHAHRVHHGDATGRHVLDGGARRDRRRPGSRRGQVLTCRHKAQRESPPDQAWLTRAQGLGAAQPDIAQAFFQQQGGQGGGGDGRENFNHMRVKLHFDRGCHRRVSGWVRKFRRGGEPAWRSGA